MKKDIEIRLREWWISEIRAMTEKVVMEEAKRQAREYKKADKLLGEYQSYADAQDAYGCGAITERQFNRIVDLLEKRNPAEDPLYQAKIELLQELYQEQKKILGDRIRFEESRGNT